MTFRRSIPPKTFFDEASQTLALSGMEHLLVIERGGLQG